MSVDLPAARPPLPVLYRDAHCIAVHKPPGMLVHRSPISQDRDFVVQTLRDQIGRRVYPVHRLDRATSGVLLFGLTPESAGVLARALESPDAVKEYRALARGWVDDEGVIDHPVTDEEGSNRPRPAVTRYRCLARVVLPVRVDHYATSRYSLVQVLPETGRRQQIRKHFKHISHHLIGDTTHGNGRHNRFFRECFRIHRLMLTAVRLRIKRPDLDDWLDLRALPEPEWELLADCFGWQGSARLP